MNCKRHRDIGHLLIHRTKDHTATWGDEKVLVLCKRKTNRTTTMRTRYIAPTLLLLLSLVRPAFSQDTATKPAQNFIGTWGLTSADQYGSWLRVTRDDDNKLQASLLWRVGSARKAQRVEVRDELLSLFFTKNQRSNGQRVRVEVRYDVRQLPTSPRRIEVTEVRKGTASKPQTTAVGGRIPKLPPRPDLKQIQWGPEIELFNGKDLTGWQLKPADGKNGWRTENGELVNVTPKTDFSAYGDFANIRTTRVFKDHRLHLEFNVEENCNSGVYVRGMYEAQVVDRDSRMQGEQGAGAIFGRIKPLKQAGRVGGKWQSYDIWLVDRHITVVLNGEKVIDNQPLEGCTGGAMLGDVMSAGPLFLQGDHTSVRYRNIWVRERGEREIENR